MRKLIDEYLKNRYEIGNRKTFSLEGLEQNLFKKLGGETAYLSAGGYKKLYQIIKNLEDDGFITIVKNSPLNGKNPSLKTRWRIIEDKESGWSNKRFFQYSDLLDLSFYQRNPEYQTEDEWRKIVPIYIFIRERDQREWASLEERSLELFADEKYLYNSNNKVVLNRIKVSLADLKAKKYGEMFIYWKMLKGKKGTDEHEVYTKGQEVLILENHSTFFSCKRVLQEDRSILGKYYDILIYGEGKKIIKSLSFLEEITNINDVRVSYFGDIDPEGFLIYRLLKERYQEIEMELCLSLYSELLQVAEVFYPCPNQRRNEEDLQYILKEFKTSTYNEKAELLEELWYKGKRLPQELITYEYLIDKRGIGNGRSGK